MIDKRLATLSLLPVAIMWTGCAHSSPAPKAELPQSVSPGWSMKKYERAAAPAGLPGGAKPECWKADYANQSSAEAAAEVWACGYAVEGSAFDAMQRTATEANTVKFQMGRYLMIVKWRGVSREEITALVRAIQKAVNPK